MSRHDHERFVDKRRRRTLQCVAAAWFLPALWALTIGVPHVALAFILPGLVALRMAMLEVIASRDGVLLRGFFRHRRLRWEEISHFELKRFGLRDVAVPSVVLTDGRRFPLPGLDSPLSGFGAGSPQWAPALRQLSARLDGMRYGSR